MSVYPRNMSTFLNRMTNYNKNNVKMNVLGTPTANNGDVIQGRFTQLSLAVSFEARAQRLDVLLEKSSRPAEATILPRRRRAGIPSPLEQVGPLQKASRPALLSRQRAGGTGSLRKAVSWHNLRSRTVPVPS